MKILLVDDEYFICQLCKEELEDEGYDVVLAHNGDEALAMIETEAPDLVSMDIKMRYDGEGVHALRQIKQQRPNLPVIMVTAYDDYKDDLSIWAADAYVLKSSDLTELKATINRLIGHP